MTYFIGLEGLLYPSYFCCITGRLERNTQRKLILFSFFLFLFFFYDCGISFLHLVNSLMISDMAKMLFS